MILAIDKVRKALAGNPTGLTIADVARICNLTEITTYQVLRTLFNFQEVIEVRSKNKRIFRLAKHDLAIHVDKHPRRSLSE